MHLAGRSAEAIDHAERALEFEERKGNLAGAAKVSALLEEIRAEAD
jgi:hypothetical protein